MTKFKFGADKGNMNKPTVKDLTIFKSITPAGQYAAVVLDGLRGEERQFFADTIAKMAGIWRDTPKTYETDGQGREALARLHYFTGGCDWWIVEKDSDPDGEGQIQAFGIADLGQGYRKLGYINLVEIIRAGAELDFHFTPVTVGEILKGG